MTTRSTTTTTPTGQVVTDNKTEALSKFEIAVAKIMEETGRPMTEAIAGITFITDMAIKARAGARCNTVGTHHLTYPEMATTGYDVMDDIMPHGQTALEGSAHAAVQALVLGPEEFALTHDNPTGEKQDCVVTLNVGYVS